ncbi:hypothetical protein [Micromonospora sp. DT47]|uniref:hypothetical protein n=1 Tax=Micromonospora sp. DT47 TaxID=3393431 RepID=UPI003CF55BE6
MPDLFPRSWVGVASQVNVVVFSDSCISAGSKSPGLPTSHAIPGMASDLPKRLPSAAAGPLDVTREPPERPYGIDFGIRDPLGNRTRIGQMHLRG